MRLRTIAVGVAAAAALAAGASALAATMHPVLGAKLAGMGDHGIVNLRSHAAKGELCWTFELPTKGITAASVRDTAGMKVAELGMHYRAKGCGAVMKSVLAKIEAAPAKYVVWVDTKGHPGEVRGRLFAGMAHM